MERDEALAERDAAWKERDSLALQLEGVDEELLPANLAQTKLSDLPKSIRTKVLAKQPTKHRDPHSESPLELREVGHQ